MELHGMWGSSEYKTFAAAKKRCNTSTDVKFHRYGGRGIEFRFTSFEEFYKELGARPDGMSLDRINNDGHYEPGNVRWATASEQAANREASLSNLCKNGHAKTFENRYVRPSGASYCRVCRRG